MKNVTWTSFLSPSNFTGGNSAAWREGGREGGRERERERETDRQKDRQTVDRK